MTSNPDRPRPVSSSAWGHAGLPRLLARLAVGLVAGAAVGGLIANATIPSHDQLQALAEDLVPPGAVLTGASVVSGFEPLVGPPEAIARFDSKGADVATVFESVRDHASQLGWTHVQTDDSPAGEVQNWSRTEAKAAVYVRNFEGADDEVIFVNHLASPMARTHGWRCSDEPRTQRFRCSPLSCWLDRTTGRGDPTATRHLSPITPCAS